MREYKDIAGKPGYQVSNDGIVRCSTYGTEKRIGFPAVSSSKNGQLRVMLGKHHYSVAALVLNAFVGNPHLAKNIKHIDENEENNNIENLCWVKPDGTEYTDADPIIEPPQIKIKLNDVEYSNLKYFLDEIGVNQYRFWDWVQGRKEIPEKIQNIITNKGEITICL